MKKTFDFIIIGAGTAGCVLARRILERSGARVLLVEAGPPYPARLLDPPLPGMKFGRRFSWGQQSTPQQNLGGRVIEWPMGKVVGGTSSINAMMAFRGHPANFDAWESAGNTGWSSRDLMPYFERAFGHSGQPGVLELAEMRHRSAFSESFLEACVQDGMHTETPLLGIRGERCGYFPVLQRDGMRHESAGGYFLPIKKHAGLTLLTGAEVRRVILEKERATAIETHRMGKIETFHASAGVIVCAGVFQTPRVLQCSGIGPPDVLLRAGVRVHLDIPAVGENFHDHVRVGMLYKTSRISPGSMRHWLPGALRYALRRDGVMSSNCCESGAFFASRCGLVVPDLELITHFQTFGPRGEVDIEVCLVSPQSRGRVWIHPAEPFGPPLVDANFLSRGADVDALEVGIRRVRKIVARPALRDFPLLAPNSPAACAQTASSAREAIFATATTAYHPCGSCAMGQAVASDLRVLGVQNLWVADASVMPCVPSGNIACAVIVLAEKAADLILGRAEKPAPKPPSF